MPWGLCITVPVCRATALRRTISPSLATTPTWGVPPAGTDPQPTIPDLQVSDLSSSQAQGKISLISESQLMGFYKGDPKGVSLLRFPSFLTFAITADFLMYPSLAKISACFSKHSRSSQSISNLCSHTRRSAGWCALKCLPGYQWDYLGRMSGSFFMSQLPMEEVWAPIEYLCKQIYSLIPGNRKNYTQFAPSLSSPPPRRKLSS